MSPKKIQEFMDLLKKVQQRSDVQKLQTYLLHFSKLSYDKYEAECLTETLVQCIDVVINLSANWGYREQIKICTQFLDPLEQIITNKDICAVFIKRVTQRIFDILIEEDMKSLCVKKELLKTFINCVQKSPKEIRSKTVQELPNMYLFKIVDSLSTYGDFDFQVTLIEFVFRMYGKSAILSKLPDLLPESEELSHSFANINGDTFDEDVRKFLNILNQNSKKVFSVVCKDVFLGRIKCGEPMENVNGLWVDFNRSERSVSWYTTTDSLSDADLDEDNAGWNHILFFVSDVELVQIYRPPKTNEAIVYVKLREPCLISIKANVEQMESADNVKFILSCESDKAKTLLSQVLPAMFKHKLHNNPFKVSLGSKIVYKPLKVSVRKRAKSDSTKSKSDTSSFSERLNPFCGTKDAYSLQGSSTLHSISSSSTKCDVISISDGSMHSNESCVNLIPKSDDSQNSQYETAQMCQLDSCKVSSVRHAKKAAPQHGSEVLSDDIFLKEDPRRFQGDIKILSGRCSGTKAKCSQSSAATLTPKETPSRKSEESQETVKNTHVWSNVAEPSSSDRYETALDLPQTQSQCVMKSWRESGPISKSPTRNKISISKKVDINILKERLLVNVNESHDKEDNEMDLSQLKEKKPSRDSKKKTKEISDKENIWKKESQDVPNRNILPVSKSTSKKFTVIDDGKYTEMAVDSEKEPNEKLTKGDIEWSEKYPDVLVAHSKPILRENILTTAGIDTQTKMRAKRKSGKAATTADIEPAEKILDVPNQEVEPAVCKPTPKKDTVIDAGKYTELKTDSQQKPNEEVATNDIPLSQEYPDILSQKVFPAHSKPTLKEDTLSSVGIHTEATMTAKRKSRKDVTTIDIQSSEENVHAPNQDVMPAFNKPTSKKDTMIMDLQEKPNEKVAPNDVAGSEDILSQKDFPVHSKPAVRGDILTSARIDTKATMRATRKSGDVIIDNIESTEKNLDVPNQEVVPVISKPTPDTAIDEGKYNKMSMDSPGKPKTKVAMGAGWLCKQVLVGKKLYSKPKTTKKANRKPKENVITVDDESTEKNSGITILDVVSAVRKSAPKNNTVTDDGKYTEITVDLTESDEENLDTPNQVVVPAIGKPITKKDSAIDDGKYTEITVESQEIPNKKVTNENIKFDKKLVVLLIQADLLTTNKTTSNKDYTTNRNSELKCKPTKDTKKKNIGIHKKVSSTQSSGESKQSKTKTINVQSEVTNEVNNRDNSDNDLFEEANVLTGITDRANDVATNLEYERQLNASTVEYNMQENVPVLESTHNYEKDFDTLKRQHNQTTTTLGSRKRRKLYNSEEFNCLENLVETEDAAWKENEIENVLEAAKSPDKEVIKPSVREQETSAACLNKRVKHRKVKKNDLNKTKKLKVLHPHTVLNVRKPGHKSRLNTAFDKLLDSFRNEAKTNLFDIVQHNTIKASTKPGRRKINKIEKKTDKKKLPKNNKRFGEEHKYQRMRARATSDLSEVSLELKTHDQCCNRETSFESCEERLPPRVQPARKINILSDIQIRPKRTLLDDKPGINKKKTKHVENPADVIRDDLSGHMSRAEICNWIETGSPNYSTKITERRNILKYVYFMLQHALEDPDETEEYRDVQKVCKILKKYV